MKGKVTIIEDDGEYAYYTVMVRRADSDASNIEELDDVVIRKSKKEVE